MNIVYSISGTPITNRVNFLGEGGSFVTAAFRGEYASGGIRIEDPTGNLNIAGWETFWVDDMDATPTRVWQGYIFDKTLARGNLPPTGVSRVHDCDIIDLNAALQFQVLHSNDAKRPDETDVVRVLWLMTSEAITGYGSNLLVDAGLISAADPVSFLATDCRGSYANAVLRTLCEIAQKNAFAYLDEYTGSAALFYDKDESAVYSSTIRISNVIADEDGTTTFYPSMDASVHQSGAERYGGVLFNWQGEPIYAQSPATVTAMSFSRDAVISDAKQIGDAATAEAEALSFLNTHAAESNTVTVTILMPSASVNELYAGHRMQVKFTHLPGFTSFTWTRVRRRSVVPVGVDVNGTWTVLWQVNLELWVPPTPVDDAAIPECYSIRQFAKTRQGTAVAVPVVFAAATIAGNLLIAWISRRNNPVGLESGWTNLSSAVEGLNDGGPGFTDYGRAQYRFADGSTSYEFLLGSGYSDCNISVWEIDGASGFVPTDATLYETTGAGPTAIQSLGAVTDPIAGQVILGGWVQSTQLNPNQDATMGAGMVKDYNDGWLDAFADEHPWHLAAHWDGTTIPLTVSCTIPTSHKYGGVIVQVAGDCGEEPLPYIGDPVGPEVPTGDIDNTNTDFAGAGGWLLGTLRVLHDGIDQTAHVTTEDPVSGTYSLDYAPSAGSTLRETYESR